MKEKISFLLQSSKKFAILNKVLKELTEDLPKFIQESEVDETALPELENATVVQVSLWIMMAMALASPLIAWLLSTIIGKYQHTHKGRWVLRNGKWVYVYD